MKLSKTQLFTLKMIRHGTDVAGECRVETGRYKGSSTNTVRSLEKRKLIVVTGKNTGSGYYNTAPIYSAVITPIGRKLLEEL